MKTGILAATAAAAVLAAPAAQAAVPVLGEENVITVNGARSIAVRLSAPLERFGLSSLFDWSGEASTAGIVIRGRAGLLHAITGGCSDCRHAYPAIATAEVLPAGRYVLTAFADGPATLRLRMPNHFGERSLRPRAPAHVEFVPFGAGREPLQRVAAGTITRDDGITKFLVSSSLPSLRSVCIDVPGTPMAECEMNRSVNGVVLAPTADLPGERSFFFTGVPKGEWEWQIRDAGGPAEGTAVFVDPA